jgi:hypothetical protein
MAESSEIVGVWKLSSGLDQETNLLIAIKVGRLSMIPMG